MHEDSAEEDDAFERRGEEIKLRDERSERLSSQQSVLSQEFLSQIDMQSFKQLKPRFLEKSYFELTPVILFNEYPRFLTRRKVEYTSGRF